MIRSFIVMVLIALMMPVLAVAGDAPQKVRLALNWVPEPEFGGFYEAQRSGAFKDNNLDATIIPGGAGVPVVQMVASGQVEFGIASADEVVIARNKGVDLVALFTVYQTCPQGIMVHKAKGFKDLAEVFAGNLTIAMEPGLAYGKFLKSRYGFDRAKIVPYGGGVAQFLKNPDFAQQCFVFSEPIAAKRAGAEPQVFLIAESGYNPYTAVVVVRGDYLKQNREQCAAMVRASRTGWRGYLDDPAPANAVMAKLNTTMDLETFAAAAQAQEALVEQQENSEAPLGSMTKARWALLAQQLTGMGIIDKPQPAEAYFENLD